MDSRVKCIIIRDSFHFKPHFAPVFVNIPYKKPIWMTTNVKKHYTHFLNSKHAFLCSVATLKSHRQPIDTMQFCGWHIHPPLALISLFISAAKILICCGVCVLNVLAFVSNSLPSICNITKKHFCIALILRDIYPTTPTPKFQQELYICNNLITLERIIQISEIVSIL